MSGVTEWRDLGRYLCALLSLSALDLIGAALHFTNHANHANHDRNVLMAVAYALLCAIRERSTLTDTQP